MTVVHGEETEAVQEADRQTQIVKGGRPGRAEPGHPDRRRRRPARMTGRQGDAGGTRR